MELSTAHAFLAVALDKMQACVGNRDFTATRRFASDQEIQCLIATSGTKVNAMSMRMDESWEVIGVGREHTADPHPATDVEMLLVQVREHWHATTHCILAAESEVINLYVSSWVCKTNGPTTKADERGVKVSVDNLCVTSAKVRQSVQGWLGSSLSHGAPHHHC